TPVFGGASGYGTVFKLAPDGTHIVLHEFNDSDGAYPYADLVRDEAGNLYGTTVYGGASEVGTVFKLAPDGTHTILHSFNNSDGAYPYASLIRDDAGNLYGTTVNGGAGGYGTVFKLASDETHTILHDFNDSDGAYPYADLVRDGAGNLYGTTLYGGASGYGTVFKLASDETHTILHDFNDSDGAYPYASLVRDGAGNLYGTTANGGASGVGTVFKLAPNGTHTMLHSFNDSDGAYPYAGLIRDAAGNLYGTTESGSGSVGTVFRFTNGGGDTTPPVVTVPGDMLAEATSATGATVSFTVSATDETTPDLVPTCMAGQTTVSSGSTFPLGATTVTCSATDAAGNTGSAEFTITVQDTTAPVVTVPSNMVLEASGPAGRAVTYTTSAMDLVDGTRAVSCDRPSGSTFGLGTTAVTCTASDTRGNVGTRSFTVTVRDTRPPLVTIVVAKSVVTSNPQGAVVTFSASANDVVSGARPVSCSPQSGTLFPVGKTTLRCTATDAAGNTGVATALVQVTYRSP
ncbi:MAG: choice-of-anchor tandem repeat GloVer-containing protein, partial [Myxococcota bacterium]